jgi:hypothetical protein
MSDEPRGTAGPGRLGGAGRVCDVRLGLAGLALKDAIGWLVAGRWLEELLIRLQSRETKWNRRSF